MGAIEELSFEEIAAGVPGGFFIYHADGNEEVIYANDQVLYLYHCDTMEEFRELTGNSFRGMVHPEELEKVEKCIWTQIKENKRNMDYVEYRIIRKDGTVGWVEDFGHLVKNKLYGDVFYVFVSDVTDKIECRRRTREKYLNKLKEQEILRTSLTSTIYAYREIYLIHLEENYYRMIYPDEQNAEECGDYHCAIERHIKDGRIAEGHDEVRYLLQPEALRMALMNENSVGYKYRRRNRDGECEWCETVVTVHERKDGAPMTVVMGIRSIEKIIQKEEKQNMILKDALLQAERANEAKTIFLANMSHDIRTPMNAVIGFSDLALKHTGDPERVQDCLEKIRASSQFLLGLIDDMLDLSRIEAGRLHIEERGTSLRQVLAETERILLPQIKKRELNYTLDVSGVKNFEIFCDPLRLNQILINVVGNAVKYTNPGGDIFVIVKETGSLSQEIGSYEFQVRDTGAGISPEFLEKIFQPFEREQNTTVSRVRGIGLGLAVTKNIVDLMNGTIEAESQVGKGSVFTIRLPFRILRREEGGEEEEDQDRAEEGKSQESGSGEKDALHENSQELAGKRILLVEDNELNREIARELLSEEGLIVDEAEDGDVAVEMVKNSGGKYALVLMDIQMPRMNGYEAAMAIRRLKEPALAKLPIIAVSANVFEEDVKRSLKAGMNAHLSKPFEVEEVLSAMKQILWETTERY